MTAEPGMLTRLKFMSIVDNCLIFRPKNVSMRRKLRRTIKLAATEAQNLRMKLEIAKLYKAQLDLPSG